MHGRKEEGRRKEGRKEYIHMCKCTYVIIHTYVYNIYIYVLIL